MSSSAKRLKNSPFTVEQETCIILEYGTTRNITQVRCGFGRKFGVRPRNVPPCIAFRRLADRFISTGSNTTDKATWHVYRRAQACLDAGGDTFERRLKKGKASRE